VRWLYPLGYIDVKRRQYSYGLIMSVKNEEGKDGRIVLLLDSGYKQSFWLSLDLLVELGSMEILQGGWQSVE